MRFAEARGERLARQRDALAAPVSAPPYEASVIAGVVRFAEARGERLARQRDALAAL